MITAKEKKAALRALQFNWGKAWRLFCFCFASFSIGLSVLYWTLDLSYVKHINNAKALLLQDMANLKDLHHMQAISDLHEGVVFYQGPVDFDQVKILVMGSQEVPKIGKMYAVKGQKREVARNVYEIRFVNKDAANSASMSVYDAH